MATILEIKTAIASYFEVSLSDLTVNGQDLALLALNQVRRNAELNHDFEFQRKLATVSVDGVTGGSLEAAVLYGTATACNIKSVIDMGLFDDELNLRPVEWTTVSESLERQRIENPRTVPRYPSDGWARSGPVGQGRFALSGTSIYRFPKDDTSTFSLGLEVYAFSDDWARDTETIVVTGGTGVTGVNTTYYPYGTYATGSQPKTLWLSLPNGASTSTVYAIHYGANDTGFWLTTISDVGVNNGSNKHYWATTDDFISGARTSSAGTFTGTPTATHNVSNNTSDIWTTYATQYLQWGAIVHLNHLFKHFVFRQEGNLPPPEKLRDEGLEAFKSWDAFRYEQNRRHGR